MEVYTANELVENSDDEKRIKKVKRWQRGRST